MAIKLYVQTPGQINRFLSKVREKGKPEIVDNNWMRNIGYSDKNSITLINILSLLGLIDDNNAPTEQWDDFLDAEKSENVIREGIQESYAVLYKKSENAHTLSNKEIFKVLKKETKLADRTVNSMVSTFVNLCEYAGLR